MSSEQNELHIIKTTILLKKVNITVRFPCSISFALKNQQQIVEHHNIHELRKGQCIINQSLSLEVEVVKRRGVYDDKKISLQICMISVNGKIPAGSVTINATDKVITQRRAPLQKCPDKNAQVLYTQNCQLVEVVKKIGNPPNLMSISLSSPTGNSVELSRSRLQYSASTKNMNNPQMMEEKDRFGVEFRPEGRLYNSKHQQSNKDLRLSGAEGSVGDKKQRLGLLKIQDMGKNCLSGSILDQSSEKGSPSQSQIMQGSAEMHARKSRMTMLEHSKDNYLKKLSKFRHSVAHVDSEEHLDYNDQIEKMKFENDLAESELIAYSGQRTRTLGRTNSRSSVQMRDMRDQLDKRRSRILQLDSSRVHIESQLSQKDKLIAQIQQEKKKLQEQLDEEKIALASVQKRLEMKEQSYKDQLKKINEKYAQSQSQRQKAVIDYNNLLATIESSELKSQYALRDKQRNMNEQKIKLNKKIDQLAGELTTAYQKIAEWKLKVSQLEQTNKKLVNKEQQQQTRIIKAMEENKDLLYELRVAQDNSKRLSDEKQRVEHNIYEDKNSYKRKYNEAMNDMNEYREKYERISRTQMAYETKIHDLQGKLDRQTKQRQSLNTRIEEYRRKQMKREQQEERRSRMSETMSMQNQIPNNNHKIIELKHRLDAWEERYNDLEEQYEEKIRFVISEKEMIENEFEEAKWRLQKQIEKVENLDKSNKELNEKVIDLSQKVIIFEEKELMNDEQLENKNRQISELSQQVSHLDQKMNYIRDNLKDKDDGFYQLQKVTEDYCKQIEGLKTQIRDLTNMVADKEDQLRKTQSKWRIELMEKENELKNLSYELDINNGVITKLRADIDAKNKEIHLAKEGERRVTKDLNSLKHKIDDVKYEDKQKEDKIQQLESALQQQKINIKSVERDLQRKTSQFDDYKHHTTKAMEQFFTILNREDAELKKQDSLLLTLPDQRLAQMQMQTIKKHNNLIDKLQQQVKILNNSVKYFEAEIARQEQYIEVLQQQHAQILKKEQEKNKLLSIEHFQEMCTLKQKMQAMSSSSGEKSSEVDHLHSQIMRYQSIIGQLQQTISKKDRQLSQLKTNLNNLDKQLFSYKQKQIKDKLLSSTEADEVKQLLMIEQERNKMIVENHKDELKSKDKVIADKVEEIKKYIVREEEFRLKEDKLMGELREYAAKSDQYIKDIQSLVNEVKQKDRKISKLQNDLNSFKHKKDQMKLRYLTFEQQIKRHKNDSQQLEDQFKKIKDDLERKVQDAVQQQRKERQKRQKAELVKEKLEEDIRFLRQKVIKLQSEIQFYTFYKTETTKKLEDYEKYKQETTKQLIRWRQSAVKNQKEASQHQNKYFKYEVEIQSLIKEKDILVEQNNYLRDKISQMDETLTAFQSSQSEIDGKDRQIQRLNQILKSYDEQADKITAQLKSNLSKTKQALTQKQNKIKQLQKFVEDRYNDISLEKLRWQKQSQNEKTDMQMRIAQMEDKYQMIQDQYEFQKLQAVREVQSANGIIQELNEVIRDKEDQINERDEIINEQSVRLEELTIQLNECIQKWQSQKQSYLPTEEKMAEIDEELVRMNKFINDLDGRNKQLLEINKRRMQTKIESKTSITQLLKEIYGLMLKHKNKILNRCQSEKEKEGVIKEFKGIQEKLDMTLKSTQIVTVRQ